MVSSSSVIAKRAMRRSPRINGRASGVAPTETVLDADERSSVTDTVKEQPREKKRPAHRFNVLMNADDFDRLRELASEEHTSVSHMLMRYANLGLELREISQTPGGGLWIKTSKDGKVERLTIR